MGVSILNDTSTNNDKLIGFLFLNLAYLLKQRGESIQYDRPYDGDPELGFAITMFRVGRDAYDYATRCFELMGKKVVRECGVTMSVSFDTHEENIDFKNRFKLLMDRAEKELTEIGDRTPYEHYFLKSNPVIVGTEDGQNNHWIYLQAEIGDALDWEVRREILGDSEITGGDGGTVKLVVSCYRKKWRDRMVRYLVDLGVEKIHP